jgi:hypothetical protein
VEGPAAELLADFGESVPLGLRFGFLPDEFYESAASVFVVESDGQYGGFGVNMSAGLENLLVAIASETQDFISDFDDSWGDARPPCPGHPHPAWAKELDGEAWWTLPSNGSAVEADRDHKANGRALFLTTATPARASASLQFH